MDTWTVLWLIGMLAYLGSVAFMIWHTVQQRSPWKMILYTGLVALLAINWFRLRPWETRSPPAPVLESPACTSLLTREGPRVQVKVNGQPVPLYVDCLGADGEMTSVRVGGEEL